MDAQLFSWSNYTHFHAVKITNKTTFTMNRKYLYKKSQYNRCRPLLVPKWGIQILLSVCRIFQLLYRLRKLRMCPWCKNYFWHNWKLKYIFSIKQQKLFCLRFWECHIRFARTKLCSLFLHVWGGYIHFTATFFLKKVGWWKDVPLHLLRPLKKMQVFLWIRVNSITFKESHPFLQPMHQLR